MDKPWIKGGKGPEAKIQDALIEFLENRGWDVNPTHGNAHQQGFPDLLACHAVHGYRWIEVKNPLSYAFTPAQRKWFPIMHNAGCSIYILMAATEDEYKKLFTKPNWWHYFYNA